MCLLRGQARGNLERSWRLQGEEETEGDAGPRLGVGQRRLFEDLTFQQPNSSQGARRGGDRPAFPKPRSACCWNSSVSRWPRLTECFSQRSHCSCVSLAGPRAARGRRAACEMGSPLGNRRSPAGRAAAGRRNRMGCAGDGLRAGAGGWALNARHWLGAVTQAHPSSPELEEARRVASGALTGYLCANMTENRSWEEIVRAPWLKLPAPPWA